MEVLFDHMVGRPPVGLLVGRAVLERLRPAEMLAAIQRDHLPGYGLCREQEENRRRDLIGAAPAIAFRVASRAGRVD